MSGSARAALGDLVVGPEAETGDAADDAGLLAEIDAAMRGQAPAPVSVAIIQDRRDGP